MKTFSAFPGNCPHNVSKDAKYSVRGTDGRVGLTYCTADDERWHMTTEAHPALADMVNDVKRTHGSGPNGPFYINEYGKVLVPASDGGGRRFLAGRLSGKLLFENLFLPE